MAAHIDLGPLLALLTGAPTAQTQGNTPDMDPGSEGKFLNPDINGPNSPIDTSQPYKAPSTLQRLIWPTQSGQIDTLNNQFSAKPLQEQQENLTQLGIRSRNVRAMNPALQPGISPDQAAVSGYGDSSLTPQQIGAMNASVRAQQEGIVPLQTQALEAEALRAKEEAQAAAVKAGVGNVLGTPTTQAGAENAGANLALQYNTGRQGVLPSEFSRSLAENRLGSAQASGALGLLPQRLSLEGTQLGNEQAIASQAQTDRPFITGAQRGEDIQRYLGSERLPIQSPFSNRINLSDASVSPIRSDELGANPFALQFLGIKDLGALTGKGAPDETFTDAAGKTWHMKTNPLTSRPTESVLQGGGTMNAPIGGGSNNVTKTVNSNDKGSMNPPVPTASSSTTLKPAMSSPLDFNRRNVNTNSGDYNEWVKWLLSHNPNNAESTSPFGLH